MELLTLIGTFIVSSLLSASGFVTNVFVPYLEPPRITVTEQLPSITQQSNQAIPDILLRSTRYQQASLANSQGIVTSAATNDPSEALVNIFCTYTTSDVTRYTTGSGFFIDQTGIILTNAHVAQFLLLETVSETGTTECVVRHGNPAIPTYEAELLYISPMWIQQHADLIDDAEPKGTGERDYALLYLTNRVDTTPLPATLPYINIDTELARTDTVGDVVTITGYPSTDRVALIRGDALPQRSATTTLLDLYTFGTNYGDIYFLGGTPIGQQGISGGPVLNADNEAIGLITTRGDDRRQGIGSLNAITLSYIDRTIEEETGFGLRQTISGNVTFKAYVFQQTLVPFLASLLEREL